jgi:predicted NUDIX family NTP pyrophosphohydrolase
MELNMNRTDRIALVVVVLLVLVAVGGVAANVLPGGRAASNDQTESEDADGPPTAEDLAHATERLEASGITVDDAVLNDLADRYGLGGAVRVLAWSDAADLDVEEITAMRDGTDTEPGMGWGKIAKELDVHPGIGSIMGGGHGRDDAPGQQDEESEESEE